MRKAHLWLGAAAVGAVLLGNIFVADGAHAQSPPEPPSRFAGTVTLDGRPAPVGTTVEARIGATSCGVTSVFIQAGQARYVVDVAGAVARPGCGTIGATVTFHVGGIPAAQTGSWRNYELVQLDLVAVAVTPTPVPPTPVPPTPTPRPPVAGMGYSSADGLSAWWLLSMAGLASLGFAGMGWAAARRS
jgi:hypothetical protein